MALARAHVWNVGDLLKSADLNGEFNNILLNPIALISPTTGAINFNAQAHVGIIPSAITTTSATSAGQALIYNGVSTGGVWGTPSVTATAISASGGSTGQVLAVTSSNSPAAFQVIPIDGGLSTTVPTAGMTYYISTGATALLGRTIGSSGQVYTVSTSGVPVWATPSASAGGGQAFSSQVVVQDDFTGFQSISGGLHITDAGFFYVSNDAFSQLSSVAGGVASFPVSAAAAGAILSASSGGSTSPAYIFRAALNPTITMVMAPNSTSTAVGWRFGFTDSASALLSSDPANGIYFRMKGSSTVEFVARSGAVETAVNTTAVMTSSFKPITLKLIVSGGGTLVTAVTDGNTAGTTIATNIPSTELTFHVGSSSAVANNFRFDGWSVTQDRQTTPY